MSEQRNVLKAIGYGTIASVFLSSTFVINSLLSGSGGYWAWTAALRCVFLVPVLSLVLIFTKQLSPLFAILRQEPVLFIKWGIIGFGILYMSLALASLYSPGWMVAAAFQLNILAGILLSPFIYPDRKRQKIPAKPLMLSLVLVVGVFITQLEKLDTAGSMSEIALSLVIVLAGAIVWPLGNRKLLVALEAKNIQLNATQRVLGMSIGSMPLVLVLVLAAYKNAGLPSFSQCEASAYSALFSGFFGGVAFYKASQMVKHNTVALSTIEATQVFEIFFTLIGEMLLKGASLPGTYGQLGMMIVFVGMAIHMRNTLLHSRTIRRAARPTVNKQEPVGLLVEAV